MNTRTLRMPAGRPIIARNAAHARPDSWTLAVLALMAVSTISTPTVEIFGIPRITLISVLFTLYMYVRVRGRLNPDLLCFVFAYLIAFIPSTLLAALAGNIRMNSFLQGLVGLFTLTVVGTYFYNWLAFTPQAKIARSFKLLTYFFIGLSVVEIVFFRTFVDIRLALYQSENALTDFGALLNRELSIYGGRPSGLFSEPSHFARYIGLMMAAYIAATRRSVASLWASGAFMLATRSISFFFALPAMLVEVQRATLDGDQRPRRGRKAPVGLRLVGVGVVIALALGGIYYTQSERIEAALGNRSSSAATGDNSLNERIVLPAGYFFDGPKPLLLGLGPTPQDEIQEYTLFATRSAYNSRLNAEYKSAVSATIFTLAGMGYVGVGIMFIILFQLRGWFGVGLAGAYLLSNIFSSGYHSTTSLVPSALLLSILSFQRFQSLATAQEQRRRKMLARMAPVTAGSQPAQVHA